MVRLFSRKSILGFAALFSMMCISRITQAQNIGPGNLSLNIDGAYVLNGESNSTGNSIATGTALTGYVSVEGVEGNGGTTTVSCYDALTGSSIFYWSTQIGGDASFTWTPTTVGTHQLYCSGTWEGLYANGTVYTATAYIPVT